MSTTTYSIGHAVARRLRVIALDESNPEWRRAIDRLEQGIGDEADVGEWARYCRAVGCTDLAETLEAMLPEGAR